jgi:1-deoxy-D-xylulose-5-phosphate reductoisomerase
MNAANEVAVQAFIEERICLTDIARVIEAVMDGHDTQPATNLDAILDADNSARIIAASEISKLDKPAPLLAER